MKSIGIIICLIALSFIGYVALKYGFHKETTKEKMYKVFHPERPAFIRYPKWYAILLGAACWLVVIYAIIQFFSE
jgi:hypothetical protein